MIVRRYTGSSLETIREVIARELGENAVIINSQKKNKMGLIPGLKKVSFEVIAAVEDIVDADNQPVKANDQNDEVLQMLINEQKQQYRNLRRSIKFLDEKIAEVDNHVEGFSDKMVVNHQHDSVLGNIHTEWRTQVNKKVKLKVKHGSPNRQHYRHALGTMINTTGGIKFKSRQFTSPHVHVVLGPTGVGKTTSIAKLTAKCVLKDKLNVGLLTIDTFRVAAVDQLREYASLLGVEFAVAFSAKEIESQLHRFQDKDIVFIDTPGRSHFDTMGIKDIHNNLNSIQKTSILLAVPANIRQQDADAIVNNFSSMIPDALLITKTDEATNCDGLTRLLAQSKLPIAYITNGQRVPEDMHIATPELIASLIIPTNQTEMTEQELIIDK